MNQHDKVQISLKRKIKDFVYNILNSLFYYNKVRGLDYLKYHQILTINFVCYGNICRSPFAEKFAAKMADKNDLIIEYTSSGLFIDQGNRSPDDAIQAAKIWDVDLSKHRPKLLNKELVNNNSLIIGMHFAHYRKFKELFPLDINKFYLLKHFGWPAYKLVNIADPYNQSVEEYLKCYFEIKTCVEHLTKKMMLLQKCEW